ncbi:MAG: branched-chain amino acid aminotransferase [Clostridiales bacterium]|nr:branched-chain amino acid aminotransferase [Clostridiales bacterium]
MKRKDLDWENIGFSYHKTEKRYVANYREGKWDEGLLTEDANVVINECAGILQYCQEIFEGLKVYTTCDGSIVAFRPDQNAKRMISSAQGLEMPPFPEERFLDALDQVVRANAAWVPPYGSGATLYIRPYMFASSSVIGVKPAEEYQFRMFCTPVGPYFKGGVRPLVLCVGDYDRAAPHGTGHLKAGLNYAMSIHAGAQAHRNGYDENMFLDAATRTYVEETGGANFLFVTKDQEIVIPKSASILPSITRQSLIQVARDYLDLKVTERPVTLSELSDFAECGLCGTAAVISPVGKVVDHGKEIIFSENKNGMGPVIQKLYDTLTGMQQGNLKAPEGWIRHIM